MQQPLIHSYYEDPDCSCSSIDACRISRLSPSNWMPLNDVKADNFLARCYGDRTDGFVSEWALILSMIAR